MVWLSGGLVWSWCVACMQEAVTVYSNIISNVVMATATNDDNIIFVKYGVRDWFNRTFDLNWNLCSDLKAQHITFSISLCCCCNACCLNLAPSLPVNDWAFGGCPFHQSWYYHLITLFTCGMFCYCFQLSECPKHCMFYTVSQLFSFEVVIQRERLWAVDSISVCILLWNYSLDIVTNTHVAVTLSVSVNQNDTSQQVGANQLHNVVNQSNSLQFEHFIVTHVPWCMPIKYIYIH